MIRNHFLLKEPPDVLSEQVMFLRENPPCPDVHQRLGHRGLGAKGDRCVTLQVLRVLHSGKRELRGKFRIFWLSERAGHYPAYCHNQQYLYHSVEKYTAFFSSNVNKVCAVQEASEQKRSLLVPYFGPVWRSISPSQRRKSYNHFPTEEVGSLVLLMSNFQITEGTTSICTNNSVQIWKSWNHTDTVSFRKKAQINSQGWRNFGPKGSTEPQYNNKATGEGVGGIRYQNM